MREQLKDWSELMLYIEELMILLDPDVFNPLSMLGCSGLIKAYKENKITIANAPGTGVADDKVIYSFIPKIIKYYLGEESILKNVPTKLCWNTDDLEYTLDNLKELVVKPASECGGYGILIGQIQLQMK